MAKGERVAFFGEQGSASEWNVSKEQDPREDHGRVLDQDITEFCVLGDLKANTLERWQKLK